MKKCRKNLMQSDWRHTRPMSAFPSSAETGGEAPKHLVIDDDLTFRDFDVQVRGDLDRFAMFGKPFTPDNLFRKVRRLLTQLAPLPIRKR
jgi:hypothetical protein